MGTDKSFLSWLVEPFISGRISAPGQVVSENALPLGEETSRVISEDKIKFRPETFEQYIGQERAKEILKGYIVGVSKRNHVFPHTLIHGNPGMGKTTLARLISMYLGVKYCYCIGSEIQTYDDITRRIELVDGGIVFMDEMHSMKRNMAEKLYPILEDFRDCEKQFTMIGATTELGDLLRDRQPFHDRFRIIIELEDYTTPDLLKIAQQYKDKVFPDDVIESETYAMVARNCRAAPRSLIRLLEASIYMGGYREAFKSLGIIRNGFTEKDLKMLDYLSENKRGVGLSSIATYLHVPEKTYLYEIEPYLVRMGLILRGAKGRQITSKGIELVGALATK